MKKGNVSIHKIKPKVKRKGIHSKNRTSRGKNCKNYKKLNIGQG